MANHLITFSIICLLIGWVITSSENEANDSTENWECGIFFAGHNGAPPKAKIYIVPRKFPTDCSAPRPGIYNKTCYEMGERGLSQWPFGNPSRVKPESGLTIGDDLCSPIPKDVGSPGLPIGFYYTYCNGDWIDTGLRTPQNLCCVQKKFDVTIYNLCI